MTVSCEAPVGGKIAAHVELDLAREFDDGLGMAAVFGECVFDRLGAIDEQSAIAAVLLLGDPVASLVLADEDKGEGSSIARGRFDKLHVRLLRRIEPRAGERWTHAPKYLRRRVGNRGRARGDLMSAI